MTAKKTDCRTPGANAFACGLPTLQIDGLPDSIQSLVQLGIPLQGAWLELCGRRVSAWIEWPGTLCACKSMAELSTAQIDYLTTMRRHYGDCLDGALRDALIEPDCFEDENGSETSGLVTPEQDRKAA